MTTAPSNNTETVELGLAELLTTSCALADGVIEQIITSRQKDVEFYTFKLTAAQFVELCRVDRFGDHDFGVQRRFKEHRAWKMAEAASNNEHITFTEAPRGSLENGWKFQDGKLFFKKGAYISLDDGQHRCGMLHLLSLEERQKWEFMITCTQDVPYEVRLMAFLQQDKSERIDSRLKLSMRAQIGAWDNDNQKRAYELVVELSRDPRSPLKDLIILEETDTRPYEGKHRPAGINSTGLWLAFTSLMSRNSPLATLPPEKQLEVCKNMIRAAAMVWKRSWKNPDYALTTARGINGVLKLMISGRHFRLATNGVFTYEKLVEVFGHAARFDWSAKKCKGESEAQLCKRLDEYIGERLVRESAKGVVTA